MNIKDQLGNTDIYLIDQILKGRYNIGEKIIDAGCSNGRNLQWFYANHFEIFGVDSNPKSIKQIKTNFSNYSNNFLVAHLDELPYNDNTFNHIICSAVLHFAKSKSHFKKMISELIRVLKPKGSLFIRMTSDFGIKEPFTPIEDGRFKLNDNSERFLLTQNLLDWIINNHHLTLLETKKTTNVDDLRCMTTLVFEKQN